MWILRLTTSDETSDVFRSGERQFEYTEQFLRERMSEPVDTVLGSSWPSESQPARVAALVEQPHPDIVYLLLNTFAYNFQSTALRLRREGTCAAIYGPSVAIADEEWGDWDRAVRRRRVVSEGLREMAERLHVYYVYWREPLTLEEMTAVNYSDNLHSGWLSRAGGAVIDELVIATALCEQRGLPPPKLAWLPRMEALRTGPSSPYFGRLGDAYMTLLRGLLTRMSLVSPVTGTLPFS